jgi:hypothetical protein
MCTRDKGKLKGTDLELQSNSQEATRRTVSHRKDADCYWIAVLKYFT